MAVIILLLLFMESAALLAVIGHAVAGIVLLGIFAVLFVLLAASAGGDG